MGRSFEIEREELRIGVDPDAPEAILHFGSHRLRLTSPDFDGTRAPLLARGRVKGLAGPAERIELQCGERQGLGRRWVIELPADGRGLAITAALENRGESAVPLSAVRPARLEAKGFRRQHPDPLGFEVLEAEDRRLLLAFTTATVGVGRWLQAGDDWLAEHVPDGREIPPGGSVESDRVWLGVGADDATLREAWAHRAGLEMHARAPQRGAVSWPGASPSRRLPHLTPVNVRQLDPDGGVTAVRRRGRALLDEGGEPGRVVASAGLGLSAAGVADAVRVADPVGDAFTQQRLWLCASGPLSTRSQDPARTRSLLSLAGLGAGLIELAEPPDTLDVKDLDAVARILPPLARESRALGEDGLVTRLLGSRLAALLLNRSAETRELGLELAHAGVAEPVHAFDFWENRPLGTCRDFVPAVSVPPGGCRVLGLTPLDARPSVIGTSLHIGMGTLEVAGLRGTGPDMILALRFPGSHTGDVWISDGNDSPPRRVAVRFQGSIELGGRSVAPGGRGQAPTG